MTDQPAEPRVSAIRDAARPPVADRAAFQSELDRLRVREKAHTREGDAIAAARRRLPMVEVDPQTPLIGADGPVPLIDIFGGRSQLIAYFQLMEAAILVAEPGIKTRDITGRRSAVRQSISYTFCFKRRSEHSSRCWSQRSRSRRQHSDPPYGAGA